MKPQYRMITLETGHRVLLKNGLPYKQWDQFGTMSYIKRK